MALDRRLFALFSIAAVMAIPLSGCGDDDSGGGGGGGDGFTEKADAICKDANEFILGEGEGLLEEGDISPQKLASFYEDTSVPKAERSVEELKALKPPEDKAKAYADMIAATEGRIDAVKELYTFPDDLASSFPDGNPFSAATQYAERAGLSDCGAEL